MHAIEQSSDGRAAFASARVDAWHRLGTVTKDVMTAEEALRTAHLSGWDVRKLPIYATEITENGVSNLEVPAFYASARTNPFTGGTDVLGVVGDRYVPVQNEAHCEVLNDLVDASGAHFETAGSLHGGRQVFVTMKLPETMTLAGQDKIDLYIAALNSHDGSTAFRILVTPIRIVCANTQHMAIRAAKSSFSIRHTESAAGRIAEARRALGLVWRYSEEFQAEANRMINAELQLDEFRRVCDTLWTPPKDSDSVRTKNNYYRRSVTLKGLFVKADTNANIRGTRWAGLQAIGEYLDHWAPAKNQDVRALRTVSSGEVAGLKQQAYELLKV